MEDRCKERCARLKSCLNLRVKEEAALGTLQNFHDGIQIEDSQALQSLPGLLRVRSRILNRDEELCQ